MSTLVCALGFVPCLPVKVGHFSSVAHAAQADEWTNPSARDGHDKNDIDVAISQITPSIATVGGHVTFSAKLTNSTSTTLTSITYSLSRSDSVPDTASARLRLADSTTIFHRTLINGSVDRDHANDSRSTRSTASHHSGTRAGSMHSQNSSQGESSNSNVVLKPGESTTLTFELPITKGNGKATPLNISEAGTYPVEVSVHAGSHEGSSRFLLPVHEKAKEADHDDAHRNTPADKDHRVPLTFLWPLASRSTIVPGETGEAPSAAPLILSDETLAGELASGGRLDNLLSTYAEAARSNDDIKQASCLAIDPDLLTTVERMTRGYSVTNDRPSAVSETTRLRDSWGKSRSAKAKEGTGARDARTWLKKLKETASDGCVISLPTSGANLNAVAATKDPWLAAQALSTGDTAIQSVLNTSTLSNIAVPGAGYLSQDAVASLAHAYTNGDPVDLNSHFERGAAKAHKSGAAHAAERAEANPVTLTAENSAGSTVVPAEWPPTAPRVTTLVADNVISTTSHIGAGESRVGSKDGDAEVHGPSPWGSRLVDVGHGVTAIPFNMDLGATLAATGVTPETAAYSTPLTRYHETLDSPAARMQDAIAVLWQTIRSHTPVLAVPPAQWTATRKDAAAFLNAVSSLLKSDAVPTALSAITSQTPQSTGSVNRPHEDPGAITSDEVRRVALQASSVTRLTTMMSNDDHIELTRFNFTSPLRTDLLRALTDEGRRSKKDYGAAAEYADSRLDKNRSMLRNLLTSVKLVPPGNVYTRTSDSSPILVVARNGLPLPVKASLQWEGPAGVRLDDLNQTLPARGSVTLQVHADIASHSQQTKLKLWLAGRHNQALSEPTTVAIQSAPGISWKGVVTIGGILVAIAGTGLLLRKRRTRM